MKKIVLLFLILLSVVKSYAQKNAPVDSTEAILKEWIDIISTETYINHLSIRGISKELYSSNLKLINLSFESYRKGNYQHAFEDMDEVSKVDNFPEVKRIKLFMLTMAKIKLNDRFKARKWYYVSKNKLTTLAFGRLQRNVENQNLSYNIDNYRKIRGGRITGLFIGGGLFSFVATIGG